MKRRFPAKTFSAAAFLAAAVLLFVCSERGGAPGDGGAVAEDEGEEAGVDFDFTHMNPTVKATYIYRLAANPREFEGKTLRIAGDFFTEVDEDDGRRHFGCRVGNVGGCACCAPELVVEFEPRNACDWPTNFPPAESRVKVTGRLKMVQIGGDLLCQPAYDMPRLVDAEMSALRPSR